MERSCAKIEISGPLRFGRQFILLSIATLLYTATVKAQNEVTVQLVGTDYGPSVEKQLIIRFCNDSDYTIVLECMTISHTLTWKSEIGYFEDITFIQMTGNFCLPILDNGFTFLLIQSDELDNGTAYISQLRVNTSTLEQAIPNSAGNMSVTCQARYDKKDIIFIRQSGGSEPEIKNVFPDEQNECELIVIWSSENRDIVDVHITLENNGRNLTPINPDWDQKWASITVPDNNVSLVITVTEENKCGQRFSSEGYQYNETRTCKTTDFPSPSPTVCPTQCSGGSFVHAAPIMILILTAITNTG